MTDFSEHIHCLARGPRSRDDLTRAAAFDTMTQLLDGRASREQAAALLVLLRVKGETGDEFSGFVDAARQSLTRPAQATVDIDWPCYAGKKRQPLWFLLAAKLLANSGLNILLHDAPAASDSRCYTRQLLDSLGIISAQSLSDASTLLAHQSLVFVGLENVAPKLVELLALREQMGVRSIVNSLVRCLNPLQAHLSVQSVFHPAYLELHAEAARQLGDERTLIFKGDSGEAEIRPYANSRLQLVLADELREATLAAVTDKPAAQAPTAQALLDLWHGKSADVHGEAAVIQTCAALLWGLGKAADIDSARVQAQQLWDRRQL